MVYQVLCTATVNMKISLLKAQWIYTAKVNVMSALAPEIYMEKEKHYS